MNPLEERVAKLELLLNFFIRSDRYRFPRDIELPDGVNLRFDGNTGTKLGTATTQKLSFYGVTPIVQQGAIGAPNTQGIAYVQADVQSIVTAVNSIRTALKNIGITA